MVGEDSQGNNQHNDPICKRSWLATRLAFASICKYSPAVLFVQMHLVEGPVGFGS